MTDAPKQSEPEQRLQGLRALPYMIILGAVIFGMTALVEGGFDLINRLIAGLLS
jgi:hypothetical protein